MSKKYAVQSYLSYSIATAHRRVHSSLTTKLREFGVQVEAWRVMEILDSQIDITMGDLAEIVLMNPPALTKLVDRMVSDGIVHRRVATTDHRKVNLVLTDIGRKRVRQIRGHVQLQDKEILDKIGAERARLLHSILAEISELPAH